MRESIPWILERLPDIPDMHVLDVGGMRDGMIEPAAVKLLELGHEVFSVDVAEPNIDKFPRLYGLWDYAISDILDVELPANSYDMALAIHVLQHIGMPWRGIEKVQDTYGDTLFLYRLYDWLTKTGVAFIDTCIYDGANYHSLARHQLQWDEKTTWHVYTKRWLKDTAEEIGFKWIDHMIYDGANDTKKRMNGAKSIVIMLQKEE